MYPVKIDATLALFILAVQPTDNDIFCKAGLCSYRGCLKEVQTCISFNYGGKGLSGLAT